jgi:hypothetical protein
MGLLEVAASAGELPPQKFPVDLERYYASRKGGLRAHNMSRPDLARYLAAGLYLALGPRKSMMKIREVLNLLISNRF